MCASNLALEVTDPDGQIGIVVIGARNTPHEVMISNMPRLQYAPHSDDILRPRPRSFKV